MANQQLYAVVDRDTVDRVRAAQAQDGISIHAEVDSLLRYALDARDGKAGPAHLRATAAAGAEQGADMEVPEAVAGPDGAGVTGPDVEHETPSPSSGPAATTGAAREALEERVLVAMVTDADARAGAVAALEEADFQDGRRGRLFHVVSMMEDEGLPVSIAAVTTGVSRYVGHDVIGIRQALLDLPWPDAPIEGWAHDLARMLDVRLEREARREADLPPFAPEADGPTTAPVEVVGPEADDAVDAEPEGPATKEASTGDVAPDTDDGGGAAVTSDTDLALAALEELGIDAAPEDGWGIVVHEGGNASLVQVIATDEAGVDGPRVDTDTWRDEHADRARERARAYADAHDVDAVGVMVLYLRRTADDGADAALWRNAITAA